MNCLMPCAWNIRQNSLPNWPDRCRVMVTDDQTIASALRWARQKLDPLEARVLLCHQLHCNSARLAAYPEQKLSSTQWQAFQHTVSRREAGEPVAYLIGEREFYGHVFSVTPATLIPRSDTELLVELALAQHHVSRVLDLGCGSGAVAVSIAKTNPQLEVWAVDISEAAVLLTQQNAQKMGVKIYCLRSDWFQSLDGQKFDLIVSNPPYIAADDRHLAEGDLRFEPQQALVSGAQGIADLQHIARYAPGYLNAGGSLLMEHGYNQAAAVRQCLHEEGFSHVGSWKDLAGIERVSGGRYGLAPV